MKKIQSKTKLLVYCLSIILFYANTKISAGLRFSSRSASIVLESANSRLRIGNKSSVEGWGEQSIVSASGENNTWLTNGIIYGDEVTDTDPPTHLIYNNSNAINAMSQGIRTNSNALVYGMKNNSNALAYGLRVNSNAIALDYEMKRHISNALVYGLKNNSNALSYGIRHNSNAIIAANAQSTDLIRYNSNALVYGLREHYYYF